MTKNATEHTGVHCEGCDHDVADARTYTATCVDGESITATWCADCRDLAGMGWADVTAGSVVDA